MIKLLRGENRTNNVKFLIFNQFLNEGIRTISNSSWSLQKKPSISKWFRNLFRKRKHLQCGSNAISFKYINLKISTYVKCLPIAHYDWPLTRFSALFYYFQILYSFWLNPILQLFRNQMYLSISEIFEPLQIAIFEERRIRTDRSNATKWSTRKVTETHFKM